jgi:hypothetical protein
VRLMATGASVAAYPSTWYVGLIAARASVWNVRLKPT